MAGTSADRRRCGARPRRPIDEAESQRAGTISERRSPAARTRLKPTVSAGGILEQRRTAVITTAASTPAAAGRMAVRSTDRRWSAIIPGWKQTGAASTALRINASCCSIPKTAEIFHLPAGDARVTLMPTGDGAFALNPDARFPRMFATLDLFVIRRDRAGQPGHPRAARPHQSAVQALGVARSSWRMASGFASPSSCDERIISWSARFRR